MLDIVSDDASASDDLAEDEPESHVSYDNGIGCCLLDGEVEESPRRSAIHDLADALVDGRDVSGCWGCKLDLGITPEGLERGRVLLGGAWKCVSDCLA